MRQPITGRCQLSVNRPVQSFIRAFALRQRMIEATDEAK
jgi:hypothetical protein